MAWIHTDLLLFNGIFNLSAEIFLQEIVFENVIREISIIFVHVCMRYIPWYDYMEDDVFYRLWERSEATKINFTWSIHILHGTSPDSQCITF